ncbi:DUF2332 domain-containing protein [Ornithinimicrobium panacihumi]|uniref:DUF2332 domain-containing protein n=1 Tax=Ornithinimicrobium panacihumi TaxID=2008449 RepID=UPI003F8A39CC
MKDAHYLETEPIGPLYEWFADETAVTSPTWERLCRWIAATPAVQDRLATLPGMARQPNRFLAAIRYLGGPTAPGPAFLAWLEQEWPRIEQVVRTRITQTNEPGRTAVTAPLLAALPQPVALLELGASAGLCLLPDRYSAAGLTFPSAVTGTPPGDAAEMRVAARLGVDLNPLDVADPDTRRWLRALVWPEEEDRETRLRAALEIAALDPPEVRRADLTQEPHQVVGTLVDELRQTAPDATPVVLHSAFLAYLGESDRQAVCEAIRASGARWVSMEGIRVVTEVEARLDRIGDPPDPTAFVLALDGEPVGWAQAHGRWVRWA